MYVVPTMRSGLLATALLTTVPTASFAALVVADTNLSGSVLNVFDGGLPSSNLDVTVSGTVTTSNMDASLIGTGLTFQSDFLGGNHTISLNGESLIVSDTNATGLHDFDVRTGLGGMIVFDLLNLNTPVKSIQNGPPNELFTYADPWSAFGAFPGPPDLPLTLTIFYDGDFPTKFFDDAPVGAPPSLIPYTEGPFQVTRLTLGTEVGSPPAATEVPLPLTGLLLVSGLGALALTRYRNR